MPGVGVGGGILYEIPISWHHPRFCIRKLSRMIYFVLSSSTFRVEIYIMGYIVLNFEALW